MSVDWNIVCDKCKKWHHLGQDMGGICSFGYGSQDDGGRSAAGRFVSDHLAHHWGGGEFLRVMKTDNLPNGYEEALYISEARTTETEDYRVIPNPRTQQIVKEQASKFGIPIEQYHDLLLQWVGWCTITDLNWKVDSDHRFSTWLQARLEEAKCGSAK